MNKILLVGQGKEPVEIKKLLAKMLCVAEINASDSLPTAIDERLFVCVVDDNGEAEAQLKTLGYKTVMFAYTDGAINQTEGNSDLEKHGYKFEDGM